MNILYICHRFPYPPKRGGKIRPFNMIHHFHKQGHKVWVASLVRSDSEAREGLGIRDYCHDFFMAKVSNKIQIMRMVLGISSDTPASMAFFYSKELQHYINKVLSRENIDLIFVHCSSVAPYVAGVKHIPKLLDFGDMDSQKWLSYRAFKPFPLNMGYWWEGCRLEKAERKLAEKFDLCTATTKMEWETLEKYETGVDTGWFPNGVDYDYFAPDGEDYDSNAISFIGRMDYYPNQECMIQFCHKVFPLLKEKLPDIRLYIVGADPSRSIKKLERINGVTVTGSVPDVRPYILRTAAMIAPLNIARGTQNKILEAMAMGVPVISSTLASGGIDAVAGEHFLTADTTESYVDQVNKLLTDKDYRQKLSNAGRERVISNHNWPASMNRLDKIIKDCIKISSKEKRNNNYED